MNQTKHPIIIQINVTANWGSTGKISELCNQFISKKGWKCYEIYGRYQNPSEFEQIKIANSINVYEHYIENLLLDNEGLASRSATRSLIARIQEINPNVIHLHNIHDHWINYKILFEYLNQTEIKIVWTFHDFWAITGHCSHFVSKKCERFKNECYDCPFTTGKLLPLLKRTKRNFNLKKQLFKANKYLTIVPVSDWVCEYVRQSFLSEKEIVVIPNGVDTSIFKPIAIQIVQDEETRKKLSRLDGKFIIMAVSSQWKSSSKGLDDYKAMGKILKDDEVIVLVGVPNEISRNFPSNIIGIRRTNNQSELAALYTRAEVICSFSLAETFGLTIIEGYACGTPAVVYDNTAPPTLITPETGFVVPNKDFKAAYIAIQKIKSNGKKYYSEACIKLAKEKYEKSLCFAKYISLYEKILNEKCENK